MLAADRVRGIAMAESLDATFFAFRKRERGGVLTSASIGFALGLILLLIVVGVAVVALMGPVLGQLISVMASGDPSAMSAAPPPMAILWILPLEFVFLFLVFVLLAAYESACHRWMIHGDGGGGFFGLKLDADTWRVYGVYWVWFGLLIAAYIVCAILVFSIGVAIFGGGADPGAGGLVVGLLVLAVLLAAIYFGVRLAPAAATSVGLHKFAFFKAWTVSSGRFWAMFGAFLLLILINVVVGMILSTIAFSVLFAGAFANIDPTMAVSNPDAFGQAYFAAIMSMFANPVTIAMLVVYQLVAWAIGLVFYVLFFGVNARAVQAALAEGKIAPAAA
jgi:hypothetical protein